MHAIDIIKQPLITEKSTWEADARHRYSFIVDIHANKEQIKTAINELYKVRVQKVSTQIRKGKNFRTRHGWSQKPTWKRATVELHPDDRIELF